LDGQNKRRTKRGGPRGGEPTVGEKKTCMGGIEKTIERGGQRLS